MSKYAIKNAVSGWHTCQVIKDTETGKYFARYDFMGSTEWVDNVGDACHFYNNPLELYSIIIDLEMSE